jgi:hypothetical protein
VFSQRLPCLCFVRKSQWKNDFDVFAHWTFSFPYQLHSLFIPARCVYPCRIAPEAGIHQIYVPILFSNFPPRQLKNPSPFQERVRVRVKVHPIVNTL